MDKSLTTIDKAATNHFLLVTILAFIFIPLSLATSFFGMNIHELNATGQPMWIFLVTAVGILLLALTIWATFYQWTKLVHTPEFSRYNDDYTINEVTAGGTSRWTRVKSFLWLISHGHVVWCWRSGILFALLTNGRKGFTVTCDGKGCPAEFQFQMRPPGPAVDINAHSRHSPVTYIRAHRSRKQRTAFSFSAAG